MKKILSGCMMAVLLGTSLPVTAQTQSGQQAQPGQPAQSAQPEPVLTEAATVKATVEKVSPMRRLLTLKEPDGNIIRLKFSRNEAPNLSQFHKGDEVVASYYKSAAVMLVKPGQEPTGLAQEEFVITPEDKSQPGGMVVNSIQTAATVEKIDPRKRQVVLKDPEGNTVKLKVDKRVQNLDEIKPGDKIVVRYTEAAAITLAKSEAGQK